VKNYEDMQYFPAVKKLADVLCAKTQSTDPLFFRIMVSYYFAKVASMMRCNIKTLDRGDIPVSMYAINLANSGHGKGHSTNIVEEQVINEFRTRFLEETFPQISEKNLTKLANLRAIRKGNDDETELALTKAEFENLGVLAFSFDSGTTAAVKQMRHKLLMSSAGSMNLEMDEIGSNLFGNIEVLSTFLELFDVGKVKQKLTKNTAENRRSEEIHGRTPTNMMLFGTPSKLLNDSKEQEEFMSMLDIGYARRCIFGYTRRTHNDIQLTPLEVYNILTDKSSDSYIKKLSHQLGNLADILNFDTTLVVKKDVSLINIEYKLDCERRAAQFADHQDIQNAEMCHRYFKVLKLAGAYAFIDSSPEITEDHLYNAIKLVEDSGQAFQQIMTQEKPYVKLALYIANNDNEVTQADISEDLTFYKGSAHYKDQLMMMASSWGYKNNVIMRKYFRDGIEFFSGESLQETDLKNMTFSYSSDVAIGYSNQNAPFDQLHKMIQANNIHWINHHILPTEENNKTVYRRNEANCIPGFNNIVIDIDEGVTLGMAKQLLGDYKWLMHTSKSHTPQNHRFRMIFPLNFNLKLEAVDYKEFMNNFYDWLPFEVDRQTNQRARKWLCAAKKFEYNEGALIDALMFIPKTRKTEERAKTFESLKNLSAIERWFASNTSSGNRSNQLIKFALMLVDNGMIIEEIRDKVLAFNYKLEDSLPEEEILRTIMLTVSKAVAKRSSK